MRNTAKKILIVDENDACRESLGASIKGWGYEVLEAATGLEAIDKASSIHPDLIMMDLRLPGMNGDEATARLKRNLSTRNIPVVISTGWTTACNVGDRVNRAVEAGAEEICISHFTYRCCVMFCAHIYWPKRAQEAMSWVVYRRKCSYE